MANEDVDEWRRENLRERLEALEEEDEDENTEKIDRVETLTEAELNQWDDPIVDISPDLPDETLVRRYVSIPQLLSILEGHHLWLSSVGGFNDDLEGAITDATRPNYEIINEIAEDFQEEMRENIYEGLEEMTGYSPPRPVDPPSVSLEERSKIIRQHCLVNCWRMGENERHYRESAVFWDAYVPDGGGVAIESTVGKLKQCFTNYVMNDHSDLNNPQGPEAIAGEVSYLDFENDHAPVVYPLRLSCKHGGFSDEKEYRIVVNLFGDKLQKSQMMGEEINPPDGDYMDVDPGFLIDAIYVSPDPPPHLFESLERLLARYEGLSSDMVSRSALYDDDPVY